MVPRSGFCLGAQLGNSLLYQFVAISTAFLLAISHCHADPQSRQMPSGSSLPADNDEIVPHRLNEPPTDEVPVVGLALGGGGTRGAAHVGVLKVLLEAGVPINCIAGTSMGAIVGGMYSAGISIERLDKIFQSNAVMKAFMDLPLIFRVAFVPVKMVPRLVGVKSFDGLYKGTKFRKFLEKELPENRPNIEDLSVPYCAVALSLVDGRPYALTKGDLVLAMQASSAVPVVRKPVLMDSQLYVDGGVVANVPVRQARRALGANFVIAVNVDERFKEEPIEAFLKIGSIGSRVLAMELARRDRGAIKLADIVVHPNVDGIPLLSTKRSDSIKAMRAGELAAREALPQIKLYLESRGLHLNSRYTAGPVDH